MTVETEPMLAVEKNVEAMNLSGKKITTMKFRSF